MTSFLLREQLRRLALINKAAAVRGRARPAGSHMRAFVVLRCVDIKRSSSIKRNPSPNSAYSSLRRRGDIGCFVYYQ